MNFSILGTEGLPNRPIVPADYPYTNERVETFQNCPPEVVAMHRLRANARAWVGRADPSSQALPANQRNDDYPLQPGYYASRAYYHQRDVIPVLGDAQTYLHPKRQYNPDTPHRQSYPLSGDGTLYPFTDGNVENFPEHPTTSTSSSSSPPSRTTAQNQWPSYQNISTNDYQAQAKEHLDRANNRLAFHASKSNPPNHAQPHINPYGTTKYPRRPKDIRTIFGPNVPGSVLPGRDPRVGISDYRPHVLYNQTGRRPITAPLPFKTGPFSLRATQNTVKERMNEPTHTRQYLAR